jgi:hypothetical protein
LTENCIRSPQIVTISVNPLVGSAETITGLETVCQGQYSVTYTIPAITNATFYIWSLPSGATGSSTTNSIAVNYESNAISGILQLKVKIHVAKAILPVFLLM